MNNPNTLESWRPNPLVYFHCLLAIVLLGITCTWGLMLLTAQYWKPESTFQVVILGLGLFVLLLWLSLRRCSAPELPGFRGLLLLTAYMTIGMGNFSLFFVIPAVGFAVVAIMAIALVSLLRNDIAYAQKRFRKLLEFYRRHRMYQ